MAFTGQLAAAAIGGGTAHSSSLLRLPSLSPSLWYATSPTPSPSPLFEFQFNSLLSCLTFLYA